MKTPDHVLREHDEHNAQIPTDERLTHARQMIESGRNTLATVELLAEILAAVERLEAKLDKATVVDAVRAGEDPDDVVMADTATMKRSQVRRGSREPAAPSAPRTWESPTIDDE